MTVATYYCRYDKIFRRKAFTRVLRFHELEGWGLQHIADSAEKGNSQTDEILQIDIDSVEKPNYLPRYPAGHHVATVLLVQLNKEERSRFETLSSSTSLFQEACLLHVGYVQSNS
ncbi:hypothetical protein Taro_011632 [Colocasia esculenta]|uniref:Uncharacterized protein n=1 Tax=Colocasia esculenta TaxID=4460 RepID=A0A843UAJ4_COLES|nr:hypothetical protein [Colocasia esculenta]